MIAGLLLTALTVPCTFAAFNTSFANSSFVGDPNLFIVGVQKGATTSLSALLSDELKLCAKSHGRKEPHFFTKENIDDRDFLHYIHGFEVAKMHMGARLTLDSTPKYFRSPEVWDRIRRIYSRECLREKKFILSLREPTVRELSSFNQYHGMCKKRNLRMCPYHYTVDFNDTFHDYIDRRRTLWRWFLHQKH